MSAVREGETTFLAGGGQMGALVRAKDWSRHALGSPAGWPEEFKSAVHACLHAKFPILLWIGPELWMLYNDAYVPFLGAGKHPAALGETGREIWNDIWPESGPKHEHVAPGRARPDPESAPLLARRVPQDERYLMFCHSPISVAGSRPIDGAFRASIEPDGRELRLTDVCAQHPADAVAFRVAEQRLGKSEARLQAAVDLVGLGRYAWDPQSGALEWDARIRAMWDLPADAPTSHDVWLASIHRDDRARVEAAVATCTDPTGDGIYDIEYRVIGVGDGVERWVATRGRTTFDGSSPVAFQGVALDVTSRKQVEASLVDASTRLSEVNSRLEAELAESNLQRRKLFELSPELFASAGFDGYLKTINPAWTRVLGHDEAVLLSTPFMDFVHPDDREKAYATMASLERGQTVLHFEDRVRCADGTYCWISWTAVPESDLFYAVGRDI